MFFNSVNWRDRKILKIFMHDVQRKIVVIKVAFNSYFTKSKYLLSDKKNIIDSAKMKNYVTSWYWKQQQWIIAHYKISKKNMSKLCTVDTLD